MYEKKCLICSVNDLLQRDDRMPLGAELVPVRALLRVALLRLVVDVEETVALVVAVRPEEHVLQAPDVVALDRHALRDGRMDGCEVLGDVLDARRVVALPVDEIVLVAHAVLRDEDLLASRIVAVHAHELVMHALRVDGPIPVRRRHGGVRDARADALEREDARALLARRVVDDLALAVPCFEEMARVVVHAEEVNLLRRLRERLEVARLRDERAAVLLQDLVDEHARLRVVAAVEAGVEHETVAHRVVEIARVAVLRRVRDGYLALERVHDADLARQVHRLVEMERPRVRHHEVCSIWMTRPSSNV